MYRYLNSCQGSNAQIRNKAPLTGLLLIFLSNKYLVSETPINLFRFDEDQINAKHDENNLNNLNEGDRWPNIDPNLVVRYMKWKIY